MSCGTCGYPSQIECNIVHSSGEPVVVNISDVVTVNNETGLLINKEESDSFSGPVPLDQYSINQDVCPTVLHKKPNCVDCHREVSIKYLEPGQVPQPGPIVINQEPNVIAPPGPPGKLT